MPYTSPVMSEGNYHNKLIMLFLIALLMLNFPILGIFGEDERLFGIPILYVYIFSTWLGIISLIFWLSKSKNKID